jgi:acetoin utilization protein AcuB
MKAKDMMHRDVVKASPDTSLAQAQRLMREHHIRHVPVVSGSKLVGLVTDRDLRNASPSQATTLTKGEINYQMDATPIRTCMTRDVVVSGPEDHIVDVARRILEGAFGCLPVVERGQLIGMITEIDLLSGFLAVAASAGERMLVKDCMQSALYTIMPHDLVSIARQRMQATHVRHLPVITWGPKLVGMLTDRDIRLAGASTEPYLAAHEWGDALDKMRVNAIMTTSVYTVRPDTTVADARQLFVDHKFGCLPVVGDDDVLGGIVTVTDLLRAYVAQQVAHAATPVQRPSLP